MPTDTTDRLGPPSGGASGQDLAEEPSFEESTASAVEADPPPWFQPKGGDGARGEPPKLQQPTRRRRRRLLIETGSDEPVHWKRRLLLWFTGFAGTGYGVSLLFHTALMIGLGLWIFDFNLGGPRGAAELGFSSDDSDGFDFGPQDSIFEEAGGRDAAAEEPVAVVSVAETLAEKGDPVEKTRDMLEAGVASDLPSQGDTDGNDMGDGNVANPGGGRKKGSNSVTKGSFTVRITPTREPKEGEDLDNFDPVPGEPYFIFIHIEIPEGHDAISVNDVDGFIEGSDKWRTRVPFHENKIRGKEGETTYYLKPGSRNRARPYYAPINDRDVERNRELPVIDGSITLRITIPAPLVFDPATGRFVGAVGIEDTIHIECKPLKEEQEFQITF